MFPMTRVSWLLQIVAIVDLAFFSLLLRWFEELLRVLLLILSRDLPPPRLAAAASRVLGQSEIPIGSLPDKAEV